jgi:hypothetical protein
VSFYVSTATFILLHCDEWDRVVALPRHKFVTGATSKIWKKGKSNSEKIWKLQKKIVKRYEKYGRKVG